MGENLLRRIMTGEEIRVAITQNDELIQQLLEEESFVLNREIMVLITNNFELRKNCPHSYENGRCIYCDQKITQ